MFFPFKDKVHLVLCTFCVLMLFRVVLYVGQITRHLHTRITERLRISSITGKRTSSQAISSVFSHLCSAGHKLDFDDLKIVSFCSDPDELMINESLLINNYKLTIYVQASSIPLNLF